MALVGDGLMDYLEPFWLQRRRLSGFSRRVFKGLGV